MCRKRPQFGPCKVLSRCDAGLWTGTCVNHGFWATISVAGPGASSIPDEEGISQAHAANRRVREFRGRCLAILSSVLLAMLLRYGLTERGSSRARRQHYLGSPMPPCRLARTTTQPSRTLSQHSLTRMRIEHHKSSAASKSSSVVLRVDRGHVFAPHFLKRERTRFSSAIGSQSPGLKQVYASTSEPPSFALGAPET